MKEEGRGGDSPTPFMPGLTSLLGVVEVTRGSSLGQPLLHVSSRLLTGTSMAEGTLRLALSSWPPLAINALTVPTWKVLVVTAPLLALQLLSRATCVALNSQPSLQR